MLGIAFICLLIFFTCIPVGKLFADISKNKAELADPEVYEIERRIYWLENVHLAYNKIKKIFDDSPDKFKCLELSIQTEPYNHNRFYWNNNQLLTKGYFCLMIWEVFEKALRHYIENQG